MPLDEPWTQKAVNSPGDKKLACVQEQIALIEAGQQDFIGCPYCNTVIAKGGELCCYMLKWAMKAVLDADYMARNLEICERIGQQAN